MIKLSRDRVVFVTTATMLLCACTDNADTESATDPIVRTDRLSNPFNKLSAHHRPIGTGAVAGVPGGTDNPRAAHPSYGEPGPVDEQGTLANVTTFRAGDTAQGRKYIHEVSTGDPFRSVGITGEASVRLRMPSDAEYPATDGDDVVVLWPHNGTGDLVDLFQQFVDGSPAHAAHHRNYLLSGTDLGDDSDAGDHGTSASLLRFPGTVLRWFEINPTNPAPIRHALDVTATRKGPRHAHVLGKTMVWPAYGRDKSAGAADENLGNIPYGTRVFIRPRDYWRREHLRLSERGKVLFDTFCYYGFYVVDGQGEVASDGGGVLQLRIDSEVTKDVAKSLQDDLTAMLPYLYPMRNPRSHVEESELRDGLPYAGGGGPLATNAVGAGSINNAFDAH